LRLGRCQIRNITHGPTSTADVRAKLYGWNFGSTRLCTNL
jgi:hypothetical protein